jgi:hypothetical protein
VTETLPTGTGVVDTTTYDNSDAMLGITVTKGTTTLAGFTYTRDGDERVATQTTAGITEAAQTYGYSSLQQLKASGAAGSPTGYSYDASGVLTAKGNASTLTYDAANSSAGRRARW